jgi:hypothetical protein
MAGILSTIPAVDQMATTAVDKTTTVVDQMVTIPVVDQTVMTTINQTALASSSIYPNIGENFNMSLIDDSGDGIQGALHISSLNPMVPLISTFDNLTTASVAPGNTPMTATFVEAPVHINAPSAETPVDSPATITVPNVGGGTGKKAGMMWPNPHSTILLGK